MTSSLVSGDLLRYPEFLKGLVKSLDHSISHRVIWSGPGLMHTRKTAQFLNKATFKNSSLITMDPSRKTIVNTKVLKKYLAVVLANWFLVEKAWA